MTYKKMWEYLKEYIQETYNGENEIETLMYQIEEMYLTKEDVIDELMKEVCE